MTDASLGERSFEDQIESFSFARRRDLVVFIIDADLAEADSLTSLFKLEGYHTSRFVDWHEAERRLEAMRPSVLIAPIEICEGDPTTWVIQLRNRIRGIHVFFLTGTGRVEPVVEAVRAGAAGAVSRPVDREELTRLVSRELRRSSASVVVGAGRIDVEIYGFDQLTAREREVLELIVGGRSNKEASRQLGISPRTIEVHRARVMEKLGARNTADLVRRVLGN
jgi:FixJ family two-component response regulator